MSSVDYGAIERGLAVGSGDEAWSGAWLWWVNG